MLWVFIFSLIKGLDVLHIGHGYWCILREQIFIIFMTFLIVDITKSIDPQSFAIMEMIESDLIFLNRYLLKL